MKRFAPLVVGLLLIVVTAVVQGRMSERWHTFPELKLFSEQLSKVPMEIGDWQGESKEEPSQKILQGAGAVGSLSRDYRNEHGDVVSVFIVCGRVQDMFFHEPKRCYVAAGFEMQDQPEHQKIPLDNGGVAEFFVGRFVKSDANGKQDQRVYWSWCGTGDWVAPNEPKWTFAGQRALYKVYLVYTPNGRDPVADDNPARQFIPVLIPELQKAFRPATDASPRSERDG